MAGFALRLAIGMLVGVVFAGRLEAEQQVSAGGHASASLPQNSPPPDFVPPIRFAPAQRLPPRSPQEQWLNPNARPPLPEIWVNPYIVCGTTIIPAPPNVAPSFAKPLAERADAVRRYVPLMRRVTPGICTSADARPRNPDAPRNR